MFVYRLVTESTVEERILELQRHKKMLGESALAPQPTIHLELDPGAPYVLCATTQCAARPLRGRSRQAGRGGGET